MRCRGEVGASSHTRRSCGESAGTDFSKNFRHYIALKIPPDIYGHAFLYTQCLFFIIHGLHPRNYIFHLSRIIPTHCLFFGNHFVYFIYGLSLMLSVPIRHRTGTALLMTLANRLRLICSSEGVPYVFVLTSSSLLSMFCSFFENSSQDGKKVAKHLLFRLVLLLLIRSKQPSKSFCSLHQAFFFKGFFRFNMMQSYSITNTGTMWKKTQKLIKVFRKIRPISLKKTYSWCILPSRLGLQNTPTSSLQRYKTPLRVS